MALVATCVLHPSELIVGKTWSFLLESRYCDFPAELQYTALTTMSPQARCSSAKCSSVYHISTTYHTTPIWYRVAGLPSLRNLQPANTQAPITPFIHHLSYAQTVFHVSEARQGPSQSPQITQWLRALQSTTHQGVQRIRTLNQQMRID